MSKQPIHSMDPNTARSVLEEITARYGDISGLIDQKQIDFGHDLFDKQNEFIDDTSKKKIALCGRRSGKSVMAAYYLIKTAYENHGVDLAYIAMSRGSAKDIIWDELITILNRYKIKYETNMQFLQIKLANGSMIALTGASSDKEIDKHRGRKYKLVIIDEAGAPQFIKLLDNLIDNILMPTLRDYDGTICMISTPGRICVGRFYDAATNPGVWSVHKWNVSQNKKFPKWVKDHNWEELAKQELINIRNENGWADSSPIYRREWVGEYVLDHTTTVYQYDPIKNNYISQPLNDYNYVFGIDFGIMDSSAVIVLAYSEFDPNMYIVKTWKQNNIVPSVMADIIKNLHDIYHPVAMAADSGGLGKAFVAEFERRFSTIPISTANKTDKLGFIELLNDDLLKGRIKIESKLYDLIEELQTYQWADEKRKILPDSAEDHLSDAMLYAWRHSLHFIGKVPDPQPKLGSKEWEKEELEYEFNKIRIEKDKDWWDI
jgi:PBSX family phage terminase large subunit